MNVTDNTIALILNGIRKTGINALELSKRMGLSKSWVSRLLSGGLKTLSEDHAEKLESILSIRFFVLTEKKPTSGTAQRLSDLSTDNPNLERVMIALSDLAESAKAPFTPRYFSTAEMVGIGQEIIKLAFANKEKPGKVAREVLALLSKPKK